MFGEFVAWANARQTLTSFHRLIAKFGVMVMNNMSENWNEQVTQVLIPQDEYAVYTFKDHEGMPAVAMVNIGLRGFNKKEFFGWYCSLIVDYEELAENGMPTSAESTRVFDWLDELHVGLMGDVEHPNALFVGRMSHEGTLHAVWQVNNPEQAQKYMLGLIDNQSYPRKFEFVIEPDEEWKNADFYLTLGVEE
ncbi:MAG: DUF695 domain-containing protein [Bacteroidales bacterium]|nr:DUF695 domain-containing protein [Bacteroidales bacterium]